MTQEVLPTELVGESLVSGPPPSGKSSMNGQEVRIICMFLHERQGVRKRITH